MTMYHIVDELTVDELTVDKLTLDKLTWYCFISSPDFFKKRLARKFELVSDFTHRASLFHKATHFICPSFFTYFSDSKRFYNLVSKVTMKKAEFNPEPPN